MYNESIKKYRQLSLEGSINRLSSEFIDAVFENREVKRELKSKAAAELLVYLDLLTVYKLIEEGFPVAITAQVSRNNLREMAKEVECCGITYGDIVRMASIRQDFYRTELAKGSNEDLLRTIGMQWFQFPFQTVDGAIRPSEFDFSVYFSDNAIVFDTLFRLAPQFVDRIIQVIDSECSTLY